MRRRSFLALLGGAVAAPVAARLPGFDPSLVRTANPAVGVISAGRIATGTICADRLVARSILAIQLTEAEFAAMQAGWAGHFEGACT